MNPKEFRRAAIAALGLSASLLIGCENTPTSREIAVVRPDFAGSEVRNLAQAGSIYISGDATTAGLDLLVLQGLKTVIDLRLHQQIPVGYAEAVEARGLAYVHLPMQSTSMSSEQAGMFLEAMDRYADQPTLIQCVSGNRSGAMYGLYCGARRGLPADAALQTGDSAGMRSEELARDVRAYLESHD